MAYRPHGRVNVDPNAPRAAAFCDRCNFIYNHYKLKPEVRYVGNTLKPTGFLVCEICWDVPNPQFVNPKLTPDPVPIQNPRKAG